MLQLRISFFFQHQKGFTPRCQNTRARRQGNEEPQECKEMNHDNWKSIRGNSTSPMITWRRKNDDSAINTVSFPPPPSSSSLSSCSFSFHIFITFFPPLLILRARARSKCHDYVEWTLIRRRLSLIRNQLNELADNVEYLDALATRTAEKSVENIHKELLICDL